MLLSPCASTPSTLSRLALGLTLAVVLPSGESLKYFVFVLYSFFVVVAPLILLACVLLQLPGMGLSLDECLSCHYQALQNGGD